MFHIADRVYLEYDFKFNHTYPYMVASDRWSHHPLIVTNKEAQHQEPSLDTLLEEHFDNDIENIWKHLLDQPGKFIFYVEPRVMIHMQIQYWKSIFARKPTVDQMHFLHKTFIESIRLMSYFNIDGSWDNQNKSWTRANALSELEILDRDTFAQMYNDAPVSPALRDMDKRRCGLEYLLMDHFADHSSPYKDEMLERIAKISWDNWLDELEHLKYEILSGNIDAGKLDPKIDTRVGQIEQELAKSDILCWTVDPAFNEDVDYIRNAYDHRIFVPCWQRLADQWGIPYDDMDELNELINNDEYEELLRRDIDRDYGSSYTRTRFLNKANQVLTTWVYDRVREGRRADLKPYRLMRE